VADKKMAVRPSLIKKAIQLCGKNASAMTMPATTTVKTSGRATCRQVPVNVWSIISMSFV
jgi:hypothetical protein